MFNLFCSVCQFRCHEACFVAVGMLLEEVGEKEDFQYHEDNKQFNEDNGPQRLAQAHVPETVIIEVVDSV